MHEMAFLAWLATGCRLAAPIVLASLGEVFGQCAGVLNIGLEGVLVLGAFSGFAVAQMTHSPWLGLLASVPTGLVCAEILGWFYIRAGASQTVSGIVFNGLAIGAGSYLYRLQAPPGTPPQAIAMIEGTVMGVPVAFIGVLVLAVIAHFVLMHTRFGLELRAAGEHPRATDAAGINVQARRMAGLRLSCLGAALGGAYLIVCQIGIFRETIIQGQGFVALAMVIFGRWRPVGVVMACIVFGCLNALQFVMQLDESHVPPQIFLALPYIAAALATSGLLGRARQPAALAQPWQREKRY